MGLFFFRDTIFGAPSEHVSSEHVIANIFQTSSPRLKKRISNEEKENYDLASDNLCSVASDDDDDDEEDDVFAAIQDVIKKPIIKIDRSILKRKSPETADGTPRRTRFVLEKF